MSPMQQIVSINVSHIVPMLRRFEGMEFEYAADAGSDFVRAKIHACTMEKTR